MPLHQQITTVTIALAIMILILELVRTRRLREEYSWLWLLTAAGLLMTVLWFDFLRLLTYIIGAGSTSSAVFFLGVLFLMLLSVQFSVRLSRMTEQIKTLGQKMALLEAEKYELERKVAQLTGDSLK